MPLEPAPLLMAGEIYPPSGGGDVLPNYGNPSRGQPDVTLPLGTTYSTTLACGVGAWGGWAQVAAATPAAYVPTRAHWTKVVSSSCSFWLQVGVGAAGSEVPIAVVGDAVLISGSGAYPLVTGSRPLAPKLIAAGSRIAVRGWTTAGSQGARVNLSCLPASPAANWYSPWPNSYVGGGRVAAQRRWPSPASWYAVPGGGVTWLELTGSAANDMLFDGAEFNIANAGGGDGNRLQLGVGSAGSEVVLSEVPFPGLAMVNWCGGYQDVGCRSIVLAGERVVARLKGPAAGPWSMAFYFEDL